MFNVQIIENNKLFSIIVACYKNSEYLKDCLDSILQQDYPQLELIVYDDCSDNFSVEYFENYIEQHKGQNLQRYLVFQNQRNLGTVKSLNLAMQNATGFYIRDIAADDALYDNHVLSDMVTYLDQSQSGIIVCDVMNCNSKMQDCSLWKQDFLTELKTLDSRQCFQQMVIRNKIPAGGIAFTKIFWQKYGPYDERFKLLEDWPMWLKVFYLGGMIEYFPRIVMRYRIDGGVVSSGNPYYLKDRKNVFQLLIRPAHNILTTKQYLFSMLTSFFATNNFVRKVYYLIRKCK